MVYSIFLDTNIIIDFLDPLRPFHNEAMSLFKRLNEGRLKGYYSESVVTTTAFVIRKDFSKKDICAVINSLNKKIILLPCSAQFIEDASVILPPDFEDALLYQIALHHQLDYFITANTTDFKSFSKSILPVITPADFNKLLTEK